MGRYSSSLIILLLSVAFGTYCASTPEELPNPETTTNTIDEVPPPQVIATTLADLFPTEGNEASGTATLEETNGTVRITAQFAGLEPGKHGFHIHEIGDCSDPDASSAGDHFNPGNTQHGAPDSPNHHAGDLGNIEADAEGNAEFQMTVDFLTLSEGPNSVLGRAMVIDAAEDDFSQNPSDSARVACGVIER